MSKLKKFRKPVQKVEYKKQNKFSKGAWISIFIGVILILSVVGSFMADSGNTENLNYKSYKFTYVDGKYVTKINGQVAAFNYFPSQLENISFPLEAKEAILNTPQVLISFKLQKDSYSEISAGIDLARFELAQALSSNFNKDVGIGVSEHTTNLVLPELTCKNATTFVPVIFFENATSFSAKMQGNCLILSGQSEADFLVLKDRLLYQLYGVI